jgi:hypothetical protein
MDMFSNPHGDEETAPKFFKHSELVVAFKQASRQNDPESIDRKNGQACPPSSRAHGIHRVLDL